MLVSDARIEHGQMLPDHGDATEPPGAVGSTPWAPNHVATNEDMPANKFTMRRQRVCDAAEAKGVTNAARMMRDALENAFTTMFGGEPRQGLCGNDIHLMWNTKVGSSVTQTPVIADLNSDGTKEILVPTARHYFEALNGFTGEDAPGFPLVHEKLSAASAPQRVDLNHDGISEWMIATHDGELVFFEESGKLIVGKTIKIPPLEQFQCSNGRQSR